MLPFFVSSYNNVRMTPDLFSQNDAFSGSFIKIELGDAELHYYPDFLCHDDADASFSLLRREIAWREEYITMYGVSRPIPRLSAWYGDIGVSYEYSGILGDSNAWTDELARLKAKIELRTNERFNGVLVNLYRNGQDSVSWHSDDESSLGDDPVVASLSLGQARRFQLKHKSAKYDPFQLELKHGSLLVMMSGTQTNWLHQVPKTQSKVAERINLTFRCVF